MKPNQQRTTQLQREAFTLVEMLVVMAIIAILTGILIPVVGRAKTKAKVAAARVEMAGLELAIKTYHNDYSRWPVPKNYERNDWDDVSFGAENNANQKLNNNDLMAILMAVSTDPLPPISWWDRPPASDFNPTGANPNHGRNPKKNKYIDPKESGEVDDIDAGLSLSGNYHDPFYNEYKISMDVNGDGFCHDWFYGKTGLSGLSVGLDIQNSSNGQSGSALKGEVMIWSAGPDREKADVPDTEGKNEDNILSWR